MAGFNDLILASAESLIVEDLRLGAGNSWNVQWDVWDGDGNSVDFTGAAARMDIKSAPGGGLLGSWTNTLVNGKQILLGNGTVNFTATAAATAIFATTGDYNGVYELEITLAGQTLGFARGKFFVAQEIATSG